VPVIDRKRRMAHPFFTIRHSTRPVTEFIDLLKGAQIGLVADVRSVPRARTNPQCNCDILPAAAAHLPRNEPVGKLP
jgi:hypothetical protein